MFRRECRFFLELMGVGGNLFGRSRTGSGKVQAADIDPEFTEAWFNKGMALMHMGKYLEAIRFV